jgi:hypothetical protein
MPNPGLTPDEMLDALRLVSEYGSITEAARVVGMNRETLQSRVNRARNAMAQGTLDPDIATRVPAGHRAKGVSTLYDAEGNIKAQWVKTDRDEQEAEKAREIALQAMCADIPREPLVPPPVACLADLCTLYTWTDYHVGMLAWRKENLEADWDNGIAESMGLAAMQYLVSASPASARGIVNIQGDFLHWDGLTAITPTHGHVLDADGRFGKVVDVAIRLIRSLVRLALQKHQHVTLLICEGNHDIASSLWLRKMFGALYEDEPRITVHDSELPYYAIQHGEVLLGFHHGHLRKNEQLPSLFAAQFRELWGQCKRVYIHTGHRHHKDVKDHPGARVIQHPTLAARDAHASRGGWISDREITAITYSKKAWAGDVNWTPEMLESAA